MAVKSVIEIDVQADAFKEFQELFQKYKDQLAGMPGNWKDVGTASEKAQKGVTEAFASTLALLHGIHSELHGIGQTIGNTTTRTRGAASAFGDIEQKAKAIARHVSNTTFQLVKWLALGGALGAATGFFGASALSGSASNLRRTAQGLTVTPGELRAAQINFSRYLDPESVLGSISNAQTDPMGRGILGQLGISGSQLQQSPAQLLPEMLSKIVQMYKSAGPQGAMMMQARGFDQLVDLPTIKRLSNLPAGELQAAFKQYSQDQKLVALNDKALYQLQLLTSQFQRAGDQIERVFIDGLSRVSPQIQHLSQSIVKVVQDLSHNENLGHWLDAFANGIEKAANMLASETFQNDVKSFVSDMATLAKALAWLIDKTEALFRFWSGGGIPDPAPPKMPPAIELTPPRPKQGMIGGVLQNTAPAPALPSGMINAPSDQQAALRNLDAKYGFKPGTMAALYAKESASGKILGPSSAGALGPFQIEPATGRPYGLKTPADFYDFEKSSRVAALYMQYLLHQFGEDPQKAFAAYNAGPGAVREAIRQYKGDWLRHLPAETRKYAAPGSVPGVPRALPGPQAAAPNAVRITVADITGGSVNINASQLGVA